ncbi:rhodanese-like domain-containing protein [Aestuariibacter sp. AA17]|uniref:Rhodanese-like domain-containing protein n=1 Tax=Fluctibacter corallii TaxID=2984329 RepID=A0ABT3A842_9ALTE|nr:rhodanese-like domain-containing protein [Aestuariibacter sp. AA17]MCV2884491.1 rhodanese-like domain-containing protein [Aestuariibacter sp. AA17]
MYSMVARPKAAKSEDALLHFQRQLSFETDCWDVHYAMNNGLFDFVLLDVRSLDIAKEGYIKDATMLPHSQISEASLAGYSADTLFVVYCAGPHCNATEKAAIKLARLGRPVKKMIGGVTGWLDEGFELVKDE